MPGFAATFLPGGKAPREGEIFRNPGLARTFKTVADGGKDAYYQGPIADAIAEAVQAAGGCLSKDDLAAHSSTWEQPISTTHRGMRIWECPPNGQGLAALLGLNILESFDLASLGRDDADYWHLLIEAKKLAFADRARFYADPSFSAVPVDRLLGKDYARRRAALIDRARAARVVDHGYPVPQMVGCSLSPSR